MQRRHFSDGLISSHDAVLECIQISTSPRDISLPQRGGHRIFRRNDDRSPSGYENPGYTCVADGVYGDILEKLPPRGVQFCHPSWDDIIVAKPPREYTWMAEEAAKYALRFIQKDLRHHIGREDRAIYLDRSPIPTIRCDDGGWVKLEWLLSCELLWTHSERNIGYPLSRTDNTARRRELPRRLQLLIDGNYLNYKGGDGKLRLQFLGVRLAPSPNPDAVIAGEPPFSHRMVDMETQFQELRRNQETQFLRQDVLQQAANWIKPWAIRASSGHTRSRSTIMELDPSWFALSASLSLLNQLQGAYHAIEHYNLQTIMTEGIKTGSVLIGQRRSSGRLHSYCGVFPPWDPRNNVTRSRSGTDQQTPMVTLHIPIVDLIREGGKVTESGVIMCDRTVPFYLVKEMWLCIPGNDRGDGYQEVEKILDYELEDEICTDWQRPLTPAGEEMRSCRSLERLLDLLCEMPSGPHDGMKADIVSRLSEYYGADWNQVDWGTYEDIYVDAVHFLIIHSSPPREARTSRDRNLRSWCLSNIPSCLSRC